MQIASQTVDSAKQFLLAKILEQAQRDQVQLSDIERRMFLFSEITGQTDWDANKKFESEYNADEYERKICSLLKEAYRHDSRSAVHQQVWKDALAALRMRISTGLSWSMLPAFHDLNYSWTKAIR